MFGRIRHVVGAVLVVLLTSTPALALTCAVMCSAVSGNGSPGRHCPQHRAHQRKSDMSQAHPMGHSGPGAVAAHQHGESASAGPSAAAARVALAGLLGRSECCERPNGAAVVAVTSRTTEHAVSPPVAEYPARSIQSPSQYVADIGARSPAPPAPTRATVVLRV